MQSRKTAPFVAVLVTGLFVLAPSALAVPISPINSRPVAIDPAPGSEANLQTLLNAIFGAGAGVDAVADQHNAGMWATATYPASIIPTLAFEYAGLAGSNEFGIWFGHDTDSVFAVDLFKGPAQGVPVATTASISFNGSTMYVGSSNIFDCLVLGGASVNCGVFTNPLIALGAFGFYLDVGGNGSYTVDQLNGGAARAVVYQGSPTNWAIAFEDSGDGDFNDMVVKVESLVPVPEPGTLLLFGTGLIGVARVARRRRSIAPVS